MSAHLWDDPVIILYLLLGFLVVDNLWTIYLLLREVHTIYRVDEVPDRLWRHFPQEIYDLMRVHKIHKLWFTIVNTLFTVVITGVLELYFGFYPFVWDISSKCAFVHWLDHEAYISWVFIILLSIYFWLKSLPGAFYEKCCIRKLQPPPPPQPFGYRVCKAIMDLFVNLVITTIMVISLVYMVMWLGIYTPAGLYVQSLLFTLAVILIVPFVIHPFLGRRMTLENTNLRSELEHLTKMVGFPMRQVMIIRVNDPNIGSNAFFYGFGCLKRIVIFDGLLLNRGKRDLSELAPEEIGRGLRDEQVVAVVCHELGHWKHGHFLKTLITFQVYLIVLMLLFGVAFWHGPIYQAVGFAPGVQPIIAGFIIVFGFVLTPFLTLSNFFMLSMSRFFEYQADEFAFHLGFGKELRQALLKLYADNLVFPVTDKCYSSWHDSHPTMLDRLEHLENLDS